MAESLFFYKLISPYVDEQGKPVDVTKNCKLTINEIDSNFLTLKDYDIKTAEFVRGENCETNSGDTLVITRNNGEKIIVPMNTELCKNLTYDLDVSAECGDESGTTLTINYKDDNGEHSMTIENIITSDNLRDVIGSDVLTKVISDNTLIGLGTMRSPLGLAGVEKTGMLAPAIKMIDLLDGKKLPKVAKKGTRYVTREYVSDYGYLYNGAGVNKIQKILDNIYNDEEKFKEVSDRKYYWRVPSKTDWDKMLNSIEPCRFRNHNEAACHVELGKLAGKFLKSECGCMGGEYPQLECTCMSTKPYSGCTYEGKSNQNQSIDADDYIFDNTDDIPKDNKINPSGVDKYGMSILPAGVSVFKNGTPRPSGFGEMSVFWTTSHIYDDPSQDIYLKVFECDKSGVYQLAECPEPYYSVRLVKDYDGSNYFETEYIDGVLYKCVLFPESGQIWLASNFANTNGLIGYNEVTSEYPTPDYLAPNNGDGISDKRTEMFINEFNGRYWEKKVMNDGDTIVIENPCFDGDSATTANACWIDSEDVEHCVEVVIPKVSQHNVEYRVYIDEDTCEKYLMNTDDLVVERVLSIIIPMLEQERNERIEADVVLSGAIDDLRDDLEEEISARTEADEALSGAIDDLRDDLEQEIEERISADTELWEALSAETEARISADTILEEMIEAETERAISAETALDEKIDAETERAIEREDEIEQELFEEIERATQREDEIDGQLIDWAENPFTMVAATSDEYNMVLPSKDKNDEHSIKIKFDGNFGEI